MYFLTYLKAFDTLDHAILLQKLEIYGVTEVAHKWITDYFTNRKQFVLVNESKSCLHNQICGVPQGSILAGLSLRAEGRGFPPATRSLSPVIGSLRIDDFCTTTPLGHVIVPSRRLVEILIYDSQSDDDVGARAANFPAVSEVCLFGFFFKFSFSQAWFSSNQNG